jgi:hypothetical protein
VSLQRLQTGALPQPIRVISGSCFDPAAAAQATATDEADNELDAADGELSPPVEADGVNEALPAEPLNRNSAKLTETVQGPALFLPLIMADIGGD